jgi:hypothetical protein
MDILDGRTAIARASRLLALLATVSLVISGLLVAPAQAQTTLVFDVDVGIVEGDCTAEGCREVTFDAQLVEGEGSTPDLTDDQLADLNAALDAGDFEITVTDSEGREQTVEGGETLCLSPGEFTVTATVDPDAVATALNTLDPPIEGGPFTAEDITINDFTEEFTVEDCPDDGLPPDGDGDASCENPEQVARLDDTDDDGLVEFTTTGDSFRVSYDVTFEGDADNELILRIRDSSGTVVEEISVTEDEAADIIISEGPGTFELEAEVVEGEATFDVTVDDCVGDDDDGRNGDDDGRDDDDGRNDRDDDGRNDDDDDGRIIIVDDDDDGRIDDGKRIPDDVIIESIPNKKLPNTGGPAVLAPAGVLLISAAALGLLLKRRR